MTNSTQGKERYLCLHRFLVSFPKIIRLLANNFSNGVTLYFGSPINHRRKNLKPKKKHKHVIHDRFLRWITQTIFGREPYTKREIQ